MAKVQKSNEERKLNKGTSGAKKECATVIVGDSILKGIGQHEISKASKKSVGVEYFSEATARDVCAYMKPVLRRRPSNIV